MNYSRIDYANKKNKWTVMKYVASLDLLLQYVELMLKIGVQIDDRNIDAINREMQEQGIYRPGRLQAGIRNTSKSYRYATICSRIGERIPQLSSLLSATWS